MPYVSPHGALKITKDVSGHVYNPDTRGYDWVQREFDEPLEITGQEHYNYDSKTPNHTQYVYDGEPIKEFFTFKEHVLWRVLSQNFENDIAWWRFYKFYRKDLTGEAVARNPNHNEMVGYIPDYDDFQVANYGPKANFHFPVWMLEIMKADGVFERFKNNTRPGTKGLPWVSEEQLTEMMEILEMRKEIEGFGEQGEKYLKEIKTVKKKESTRKAKAGRTHQAAQKRIQKEIMAAQIEANKKLDPIDELIPEQDTTDVEDDIEFSDAELAEMKQIFNQKPATVGGEAPAEEEPKEETKEAKPKDGKGGAKTAAT